MTPRASHPRGRPAVGGDSDPPSVSAAKVLRLAVPVVAVAAAVAWVAAGCDDVGHRGRGDFAAPPPPPPPVAAIPPQPQPQPVFVAPPPAEPQPIPDAVPVLPPPPPPPQPVVIEDPEIPLHEAIVGPAPVAVETVVVRQVPPPAVVEVRPPPPGPDTVWIPGYWWFSPRLGQWVWVSGCWRRLPPAMVWVPGRYVPVAGGYVYEPGRFVPSGGAVVAPVAVVNPPPPHRPEPVLIDRRPGPDFVWVPGFYDVRGTRYAWVPGEWRRPPAAGMTWVEPTYVRGPDRYHFRPGRWDFPPENRGTAFRPVVVNQTIINNVTAGTGANVQVNQALPTTVVSKQAKYVEAVNRSRLAPPAGTPPLVRQPPTATPPYAQPQPVPVQPQPTYIPQPRPYTPAPAPQPQPTYTPQPQPRPYTPTQPPPGTPYAGRPTPYAPQPQPIQPQPQPRPYTPTQPPPMNPTPAPAPQPQPAAPALTGPEATAPVVTLGTIESVANVPNTPRRQAVVKTVDQLRGKVVAPGHTVQFDPTQGELSKGRPYVFVWDHLGRVTAIYPVVGDAFVKDGRRVPLAALRK